MQDDIFVPANLAVKANQPVTVAVSNDGKTTHNWALCQSATDCSQFIAEGDLIRPGDKGTLTFTVSQPGTYRIVCEPHVGKGMVGTLVVQ